MTTEEMHEYNKRQAINDLSYYSVCTTDFTIELRKFMTKWLDKAYEAGFKDSQRNGRCDIWVINNTITDMERTKLDTGMICSSSLQSLERAWLGNLS